MSLCLREKRPARWDLPFGQLFKSYGIDDGDDLGPEQISVVIRQIGVKNVGSHGVGGGPL